MLCILTNINHYFSFYKFMALTLLLAGPIHSSANDYSVEHIINLEQKLSKLQSEIYFTQTAEVNHYHRQNATLYHLKKKSWDKSLQSILPENSTATNEYKHCTNILYGIALQGKNNKKEAISYYKKVPDNSSHYATAQLNIALLYLHDGLSNKSISIINKILASPSTYIKEQTKNHALLILGYIYYKEKKYTASREVFGNVSIDSIYSNKALLGIALNTLQLKDYNASQNILSLLNNNINYDLPVDESYLLIAYIYKSQKKFANATVAYNTAITHYQKRIQNINHLLQNKKALTIDKILNNHIFIVSGNKIDLSNKLPATFFDNYTSLVKLVKTIKGYMGTNNDMHTHATSLYNNYSQIINNLLITLLLERKKALLDYLNQSKYGLLISNDKLLLPNNGAN